MLLFNFLCLFYLMVLITSHTISKSITNEANFDEIIDSLNGLDLTTEYDIQRGRYHHKYRREESKHHATKGHKTKKTHTTESPNKEKVKSTGKDAKKTTTKASTVVANVTQEFYKSSETNSQNTVLHLWKRLQNKLKKKAKNATDKETKVARKKKSHSKDNKRDRRKEFLDTDLFVNFKDYDGASKERVNKERTGFLKRNVEDNITTEFSDFDGRFSVTKSTKPQFDKPFKAYEPIYIKDYVSQPLTTITHQENGTPTIYSLNDNTDKTNVLFTLTPYTSEENKQIDKVTEPSEKSAYDFSGTASIEALLNDIKFNAMKMIAEQNPSVTDIITNAVTETTFEADPLLNSGDIKVEFASLNSMDSENFKSQQMSRYPIALQQNLNNKQPVTVSGVEHDLNARSVKEMKHKVFTMACNLESKMQRELKCVYCKAKHKLYKQISRELDEAKEVSKTVLESASKELKDIAKNIKPAKPCKSKCCKTTKPCIQQTTVTSRFNRASETAALEKKIQQQYTRTSPTTAYTLASLEDDYAMLTLFEQVLSKTHEDNVMKMLTTQSPVSKRRSLKDKFKLSKRNLETVEDLTLKENIRKLDDGEGMPDSEDTPLDNNDDFDDDTKNITNNIERQTGSDVYNVPMSIVTETVRRLSTEDTSFEGLTNKISFNEYVNGYKHYLNFTRQLNDRNFSDRIRYQAHMHHSVDDIGKFILEKLPTLPKYDLMRSKRYFFDDSDSDEQDISTKSDDSWFKKHFYLFLDNPPAKKYHTSQTVSLKFPAKDSTLPDIEMRVEKRKGNLNDEQSGTSFEFSESTGTDPTGSDMSDKVFDLDDMLRTLNSHKTPDVFYNDTNNEPYKSYTQTTPSKHYKNLNDLTKPKNSQYLIDKLLGRFGRKSLSKLNRNQIIITENQIEVPERVDRYKRNEESEEKPLQPNSYVKNQDINNEKATLPINIYDRTTAPSSNDQKKNLGYVDMNLVAKPTATVRLKSKKGKLGRFLDKLKFHKHEKKKSKRNVRRERYNPFRELKKMFEKKSKNQPFDMDYNIMTTELNTFKVIKYNKLEDMQDMINQVPNITFDDPKAAGFKMMSNSYKSNNLWAPNHSKEQTKSFSIFPDTFDMKTKMNNFDSNNQPFAIIINKATTDVNFKNPFTPKITEDYLKFNPPQISVAPVTIEEIIKSVNNIQEHVNYKDTETEKTADKNAPQYKIKTKTREFKGDFVPMKVAKIKYTPNIETLTVRSITRTRMAPYTKEYKQSLSTTNKKEIETLKSVPFYRKDYNEAFTRPALRRDRSSLVFLKDVPRSTRVTSTVKAELKTKTPLTARTKFRQFPDYFNDLINWHRDVLTMEKVTNPQFDIMMQTLNQDVTTPDLKNLREEVSEMKSYLNSVESTKTTDKIRQDKNGKPLQEKHDDKLADRKQKAVEVVNNFNKQYIKSLKQLDYDIGKSLARSHQVVTPRSPDMDEEPVSVDTTLLSYDDTIKMVSDEINEKNIPYYSKPHKVKGTSPKAKVSTPPEQYFTTPVPMQTRDFERFLKENQMDVQSMTSPFTEMSKFEEDWSKRVHQKSKLMGVMEPVTQVPRRFQVKEQTDTTTIKNHKISFTNFTFPDVSTKEREVDEELEYLDQLENTLILDEYAINDRAKRDDNSEERSENRSVKEKRRLKIKTNDASTSTTENSGFDITIIDLDEKLNAMHNIIDTTELVQVASSSKDPSPLDDIEATLAKQQRKFKMLTNSERKMHNNLLYNERKMQKKKPDTKLKLFEDRKAYSNLKSMKNHFTAQTAMDLAKKVPDLKQGRQPKRLHISGHTYKYDVIYDDVNHHRGQTNKNLINQAVSHPFFKNVRQYDSDGAADVPDELNEIGRRARKAIWHKWRTTDPSTPDSSATNLKVDATNATRNRFKFIPVINKLKHKGGNDEMRMDPTTESLSKAKDLKPAQQTRIEGRKEKRHQRLPKMMDMETDFETMERRLKMPFKMEVNGEKSNFTNDFPVHEAGVTNDVKQIQAIPDIGLDRSSEFNPNVTEPADFGLDIGRAEQLTSPAPTTITSDYEDPFSFEKLDLTNKEISKEMENKEKLLFKSYGFTTDSDLFSDLNDVIDSTGEDALDKDDHVIEEKHIELPFVDKKTTEAELLTGEVISGNRNASSSIAPTKTTTHRTTSRKTTTRTKTVKNKNFNMENETACFKKHTSLKALKVTHKPKLFKRHMTSDAVYTAKDVAALEIIVDLMKEAQDDNFSSNLHAKSALSQFGDGMNTNAIQVHIAIPRDYNDKKRSAEPEKLRKVFVAKMSSPVDLEYQVKSYEVNEKTESSTENTIISPGMYLVVENNKPHQANQGFVLKPVKVDKIREVDQNDKINVVTSTAKTTSPKNIARVTLTREFIQSINDGLVKLYHNLNTINGTSHNLNKRDHKSSCEKNKPKSRRKIIWDKVRKFFGHDDRVCTCKCRANETMCKACAASDAVMTELLFEFDNLSKYMSDHCTELQTFFWMNPTGGRKLRDLVRKIDKNLNDYYKRVKGKCQGQRCSTFQTYIDKREFTEPYVITGKYIGKPLLDDLEHLSDDIKNVMDMKLRYDDAFQYSAAKFIQTADMCLPDKEKRSLKNKMQTRSVYSLDNISVNIICNQDQKSTVYGAPNLGTNLNTFTESNPSSKFQFFDEDEIIPHNKMSFRKWFKKKVKNKSKHGKRNVIDKVESPLISDPGGSFWNDYLKSGNNMVATKSENPSYNAIHVKGVEKDNIKRSMEPNYKAKLIEIKPLKNLNSDKSTKLLQVTKPIETHVLRRSDDSTMNMETTKAESLSYNMNELIKLFESLPDVQEMKNISAWTEPTTESTTTTTKKKKKKKTKTTNISTKKMSTKTINIPSNTKIKENKKTATKPNVTTSATIASLIDTSANISNSFKTKNRTSVSEITAPPSTFDSSPKTKLSEDTTPTATKRNWFEKIISKITHLDLPEHTPTISNGIEDRATRSIMINENGTNLNVNSEATTTSYPTIFIIEELVDSSLKENESLSDAKDGLLNSILQFEKSKIDDEINRFKKHVRDDKSKEDDRSGAFVLESNTNKFMATSEASNKPSAEYAEGDYDFFSRTTTKKPLKQSLLQLLEEWKLKMSRNKVADTRTAKEMNQQQTAYNPWILGENVESSLVVDISTLMLPETGFTEASIPDFDNSPPLPPMLDDTARVIENILKVNKPIEDATNNEVLNVRLLMEKEHNSDATTAKAKTKLTRKSLTATKKLKTTKFVAKAVVTNSVKASTRSDNKEQKEARDRSSHRQLLCDVTATAAHVAAVRRTLPLRDFERYVRNITCYKYKAAPEYFIIEPNRKKQKRVNDAVKWKHDDKGERKILKWDWIRNKRSLLGFDVYSRDENDDGKANSDEGSDFEKDRVDEEANIDEGSDFEEANDVSVTNNGDESSNDGLLDDDDFDKLYKSKGDIYRIKSKKKEEKRVKRTSAGDLNKLIVGLRNLPPIKAGPNEILVTSGEKVTVDCYSKNSKPKSDSVTWVADRPSMLMYDNVAVVAGAVVIKNVLPRNVGNYTCLKEGKALRTVRLTLLTLPQLKVVFMPMYYTQNGCTYDDLRALQHLGTAMSDQSCSCGPASVTIEEPICLEDRDDGTRHARAIGVASCPTVVAARCGARCLRDVHCALALLCAANAPALATVKVLISRANDNKTLIPSIRNTKKLIVTHTLRKKDLKKRSEYHQLAATMYPGDLDVVVSCPAGYYLMSELKICAACPADTFSLSGENECSACGNGAVSEPGASRCRIDVRRLRRYDWWWYPPCGYTVAAVVVISGCVLCALLSHVSARLSRGRETRGKNARDDARIVWNVRTAARCSSTSAAEPPSPSAVILARFFRVSHSSSRASRDADSQETKFERWKERNKPPPLPPIDFDLN